MMEITMNETVYFVNPMTAQVWLYVEVEGKSLLECLDSMVEVTDTISLDLRKELAIRAWEEANIERRQEGARPLPGPWRI